MCSAAAVEVLQALDGVVAPLEQLTALGVAALGPDDLRLYISRCQMVANRAEYLGAVALGALDQGTSGGTVTWMKGELKMSGGAAAERLQLARRLDAHPKTAAMMSSGEISYEQAAIVARSTGEVAPEDAAAVEERLLPAMSLDPDRLRHLAKGIVAEVDRDALRRHARRAWAKRGLHLGRDTDGVVSVRGYLTSEAAAHWRASTEPFLRPSGPDDERTADQRMPDAVAQVMRGAGASAARGASAAGAPGAGGRQGAAAGVAQAGRRPQVVVTVPLATLLGEDGPPALLQGVVPISREELAQCVCEGDLTVLLKDARGNIAYQARSARLFSPAKRRAIISNHPLCCSPGCGRLAVECDMHHADEVNAGGETTADTGAPLCWEHHTRVHREGWALIREPDGALRMVPEGHPDHPGTGLTADEYSRRRLRAMTQRDTARRVPRSTPRAVRPGIPAPPVVARE